MIRKLLSNAILSFLNLLLKMFLWAWDERIPHKSHEQKELHQRMIWEIRNSIKQIKASMKKHEQS